MVEDSITAAMATKKAMDGCLDVVHITSLEKCDSEVDVVLLDLNLKESEGTDTVKRCRALYPLKPIVVFTGWDGAIEIDCIHAGADFFLKKDVSVVTILRAIEAAVLVHRSKLGELSDIEVVQQGFAISAKLLDQARDQLNRVKP